MADLISTAVAGPGSDWWSRLRPASISGVPFGVLGGQLRVGRRNAVHEYPFKDQVWVEDLGRAAKRIQLTGFLVENAAYGGGSVIDQRDALIRVCESPGEKTLVHPTLGSLSVSLIDTSIEERREAGRSFEISFTFVEAGQPTYPSVDTDTGAAVGSAANAADAAAASDFAAQVATPLTEGAAVLGMAIATAVSWASQATGLVCDASMLMHAVATLPGNLGRYAGGALVGFGNIGAFVGGASTVQQLIGASAAAREAVASASSTLAAAAASLGTSGGVATFSASAQLLAQALQTSAADPADAVRLSTGLAQFEPQTATDGSPIGQALGTMQTECGNLFRRAAVTALCRAGAAYQPSSFDDALALRTQICALLDAEILVAGNAGDDASFVAFRALRAASAQDLARRGAALPVLINIRSSAPLPAPVLAQRYYRDPTRAAELVIEADPPHPAFMPTSFMGLAS